MLISENTRIVIGGDHAGFQRKREIIDYLNTQGVYVEDMGAFSEESVDYPDFAHAVASKVVSDEGFIGILLCGSGNGVAMAANKHPNVRAALCWNTEIASLARLHNNANVLVIPARFVTEAEATSMVEVFLNTAFEGGRHEARVGKINC